MLHTTRIFSVQTVATPEALAETLTEHTHVLCAGFQLGDVCYLNDSFSEDGAAEYAVARRGRQIESITFSWCTRERALALIQMCQADTTSDYGLCASVIDPNPHHRCGHCA